MKIEISEEYERKLLSSKMSDECLQIINNILNNVENGNAFLYASSLFFETLKNNYSNFFSYPIRLLLDKLVSKRPTMFGEAKQIKPLVILCEKDKCDTRIDGTSKMSLEDLPQDLSSTLYCENISDTNFYLSLFRNIYPGLSKSVNIKCCSFGGNNLSLIEDKIIKTKEFILAIADSDQKYPTCKLGDTAKKLKSIFNKNNHPYSNYYVLQVHEKENLVPCEYLRTNAAELNKLIQIIGSSSDVVKEHFDIKSGVKEKHVATLSTNSHWATIYQNVLNQMQLEGYYINEAKDDQKVISGIGDRFVESLVITPEEYSNYLSLLTPKQRNDISNIFNLIVIFGYRYRFKTSF